jgi:light-regulated signal transduction histidine kinase (bacteriophytochrome)
LQEPLRAVNSYTQLLARKYQDKLDDKADKYINYIVEGATRMQQLINDLLEFSRIGRHGKDLVPTDCETVLGQVLAHLKVAIAQSHATVTHDPLPIVMGDETQLIQLLQNLICNAIKFRREEPPQVHITAVQSENEWIFSVRDNGIGIESEYFERIFTIFQRLHSRSDYPGTGIGLAVCKKIIERHQGRIWVESELGVGTTFHFTVPQTRQ